jgi:hypothetical protein
MGLECRVKHDNFRKRFTKKLIDLLKNLVKRLREGGCSRVSSQISHTRASPQH